MVLNCTVGPSPFEVKLAVLELEGMTFFNLNGWDDLYVGPMIEFHSSVTRLWCSNWTKDPDLEGKPKPSFLCRSASLSKKAHSRESYFFTK